jgi:membrane-bound acyltransferase YfiQ involved in biofilm formation
MYHFSYVYEEDVIILVCWVFYFVRGILFGARFEALRTRQVNEILVNLLYLACLCGLLYVFFQYLLEHLEFFAATGFGLPHFDRN